MDPGDRFIALIHLTARQYSIQQAGADRVLTGTARLGRYAGVLRAAVLARQQSRMVATGSDV